MDENKVIICLKIALKVKSESEVAQSCPALRDPMDHSPPDSSIHGIFQARVLECGAIVFSRPNPSEADNLIPDNSNWTKGQNVTSSSLEPIPEHICGKQGLGKHPAGVASVQFSCLVVSNSLRPHGLQPTRLLHPWDFPGKSTGVACHCLL